MRIELAEQDLIDSMQPLAREFFSDILAMDFDECLVTDESCLSDFCFRGLPEGSALADLPSYEEALQAWEGFIAARIEQRFSVRVADCSIRLVALLQLIEDARRGPSLH